MATTLRVKRCLRQPDESDRSCNTVDTNVIVNAPSSFRNCGHRQTLQVNFSLRRFLNLQAFCQEFAFGGVP
jgi:hypothetical protein